MPTNRVKEEGNYLDWTNGTGSPVVSGQPVLYDGVGRVAVAQTDIAAGATGSVHCEGVYDFTKETTANVFTAGMATCKLSAAGLIQLNAGGGTLMLNVVVIANSGATETTVRVKLLD